MAKEEEAIRKAATALGKAIEAGRAVGLVVEWPRTAAELSGLAISEIAVAAAPGETDGADNAK